MAEPVLLRVEGGVGELVQDADALEELPLEDPVGLGADSFTASSRSASTWWCAMPWVRWGMGSNAAGLALTWSLAGSTSGRFRA